MSIEDAFIRAEECRQRNRFWRGEREVIEYPPIGRAPVARSPRGVQPLRQLLAADGMLILAEPQKFVGPNSAGQSQPLRSRANPFASHPLPLVVIVTDAQMFLEILPCIFEIVLRLCCDHSGDNNRTPLGFCVSHTPSHPWLVG